MILLSFLAFLGAVLRAVFVLPAAAAGRVVVRDLRARRAPEPDDPTAWRMSRAEWAAGRADQDARWGVRR